MSAPPPANLEAALASYATKQRDIWATLGEAVPVAQVWLSGLRLTSLANESRGQSRKAAIIKGAKRADMKAYGWRVAKVLGRLPAEAIVAIVRVGPKALDDDNLTSSAKNLRDGLAAGWGIDDGAERVDWRVLPHVGPAGVLVRVYRRRAAP